jgi:hypothetical protein
MPGFCFLRGIFRQAKFFRAFSDRTGLREQVLLRGVKAQFAR